MIVSEFLAVLAYVILFLGLLSLVMRWHTKHRARKLLRQQKTLFSGKLTYAKVSPRDFPWLDSSYYERVTNALEQAGFCHVADVECLTATSQFPGMRTFIRTFLGDGGTVMAGIYHVKVRGLMGIFAFLRIIPRSMKVVEFDTEFSDETFLTTNNQAGLNVFADFPGIDVEQLETGTPPEKVLLRHRERLRDAVENGAEPVVISTEESLLASQDRMHALKSRHKKQSGYVTRQEFAATAGGRLTDAQREFVDEFEKARDEEK